MKRYEINRTIRELLKISGGELAEHVEVTKQTISNYERGIRVMRPVERVIEIELDFFIESCSNNMIKDMCYQLKSKR